MSKETVVVLQSSEEESILVASELKNYFNVLLATNNWVDAISCIEREKPTFFITALLLKQTDGISAIKAVKQLSPKTHCLVISVVENGELVKEAMSIGAEYYMIKPVDYQTLTLRMNETLKNSQTDNNVLALLKEKTVIDERISRIFIGMGIPPHIKGYGYLREGVKLAVAKPELINCVTKKLYPMIGEKFSTSASKVERAIRHAIEVAWNKGRVDAFNALFGVRAYSENEKPTNSEFIALIADRLLLDGVAEIKNNNSANNRQ